MVEVVLLMASMLGPGDRQDVVLTDYLGRPAPLALESRSGLPIATPPVATGTPAAAPGQATAASATAQPAGEAAASAGGPDNTLARLRLALGLVQQGLKASDVARGLFAANEGAQAFQGSFTDPRFPGMTFPTRAPTVSGQVPPGAIRSLVEAGYTPDEISEIFSGAITSGALETGGITPYAPSELATVATETGAAGAGAEAGAEAGAGAGGASLASLAPYLAYIGPAINIAQRAEGSEPAGTQAGKAAVEVASAAAAPYTFGLSALIPLVAQFSADQGISSLWDPGASLTKDWTGIPLSPIDPGAPLVDMLYGTGEYGQRRWQAGKDTRAYLTGLSRTYQAALDSGEPRDVLTALQEVEGPRGEIRSELVVPPDLAPTVGLTPGRHQWSEITPETFTRLLGFWEQTPAALSRMLLGSGDVGYLPQRQAEDVARLTQDAARQLLEGVIIRRAFASVPPAEAAVEPAPPAPEPAPPATTTTPGGPAALRADELQAAIERMSG